MAPSIKQAPISCPGHTRPVVDICFSMETDCGSLFIAASKDGRAMLRRGDTGDWIGTFLGHQGAVWSCVLDAHATKAATGAADFTAKVWDTVSGAPLVSVLEDHIVRCVDMSRTDSGAYLLTGNNRKKLSVYDLISPTTPLWSVNAHDQFIRRALWCDSDRHVMSVSEDATLKLWDLKEGKNRAAVTTAAPVGTRTLDYPLTDLQFRHPFADQTGPTTFALACGRSVQLYSFDWRNPVTALTITDPRACFQLPCLVNSVSLHPDRDLLVCGGEDHYVYRLDAVEGSVLETCKGHFGPVHCVRFSPDGHVFTSGSEDGTVRMWQTDVGSEFGLWHRDPIAPPIPSPGTEAPTVESTTNAIPFPTQLADGLVGSPILTDA